MHLEVRPSTEAAKPGETVKVFAKVCLDFGDISGSGYVLASVHVGKTAVSLGSYEFSVNVAGGCTPEMEFTYVMPYSDDLKFEVVMTGTVWITSPLPPLFSEPRHVEDRKWVTVKNMSPTAPPEPGKTIVQIRVTDKVGKPIKGAVVRIDGTEGKTDEDGIVKFVVQANRKYTVYVTYGEYTKTFEVYAIEDAPVSLDISLDIVVEEPWWSKIPWYGWAAIGIVGAAAVASAFRRSPAERALEKLVELEAAERLKKG